MKPLNPPSRMDELVSSLKSQFPTVHHGSCGTRRNITVNNTVILTGYSIDLKFGGYNNCEFHKQSIHQEN